MQKVQLLSFGKGNAKLSADIITFSLPAGFTCPGAYLCQSYADRVTGKIKDGKHTSFRCFAASQESAYPNVRAARWNNFERLRACKSSGEMSDLILRSLDVSAKYVRIHVSGDYFSLAYLQAWLNVASQRPDTVFYSYTKSGHLLAGLDIPENFRITLSYGGKFDGLIESLGFKTARVVFDPVEAEALGLEIDHDDSHAYNDGESFALLIHGTQPAGSEASQAIKALKAGKVKHSYSSKKTAAI
jgi:hypothetical protein